MLSNYIKFLISNFKDVVHMHIFVSHLSASQLVHVAAHQVMSQFRSFLASSANAFKWHEPHISLDCQKNLATTWEFLICECWESGMFPIEHRALHLLRSIPHYLRSHFQHGAGFLKIYFMSHVSQTRSKPSEFNRDEQILIVCQSPSDDQWCF